MTPAEISTTRARLGLTQAGFAQLVGTTTNYVARLERGEAAPGETLARLIRLMDDEAVVARLAAMAGREPPTHLTPASPR